MGLVFIKDYSEVVTIFKPRVWQLPPALPTDTQTILRQKKTPSPPEGNEGAENLEGT